MKILVKKGLLSHKGQMYKKGDIVDIADTAICKRLLKNESFEKYTDETAEEIDTPTHSEGNQDETGIDTSDVDNNDETMDIDTSDVDNNDETMELPNPEDVVVKSKKTNGKK